MTDETRKEWAEVLVHFASIATAGAIFWFLLPGHSTLRTVALIATGCLSMLWLVLLLATIVNTVLDWCGRE